VVIPLGVNPLPEPNDNAIRELKARAGLNGQGKVLLTVGRLIERKGVAWFAEHVLPELPDDVVYIVVGEGKECEVVRDAAARAGVSNRVRLLGCVPRELVAAAYRTADLFVMPNVPVPGDMEGFGLVALEAAASGVPVVASDLEGITEAVQHERNGLLVPPRSKDAYASTLNCLLALPREQRRHLGERFREYTLRNYGWDRAARRYLDVIRRVALQQT
jgi:phosphatidylinositol alpha-1,6-mannosyltransferase